MVLKSTKIPKNTTDPESQTMKNHDGWKQGYNGQAMVDCDSPVIEAQDITTVVNY
jgi:hypothetical protein